MIPEELERALEAICARYTCAPLVGPDAEARVEAHVRAELTALGVEVEEARWRDGDYGRILDVRVAVRPEVVTVDVVKVPV